MISTELLIVGAGAAGLSCAAGAAKAGVSEIVIADTLSVPGGILPQCLHRGFGLSLYGREITVRLYHFLRPTVKMASLEAVMAQVKKDAQAARELLGSSA